MKKKVHREPSRKRARILVVDDHVIVRQGLMKLINEEPDLMVCAEADNASQALEALDKQHIDLAVVDISLEGMSGLELTEIMKSRRPDLIVLILSMHDGLLYAQRALRAGAAGYVAKHEAAETVIAAIRQVLSGKIYVSNSKVAQMLSDTAADDSGGLDPDEGISSDRR